MTNNTYSTPEALRIPHGQTPEALAFQIAEAALSVYPADLPFTEAAAKMIGNGATDEALSIYIRELANF